MLLTLLLAGAALLACAQETAKPLLALTVCYGVYSNAYHFDAALQDYILHIANAQSDGVKDLPAERELLGQPLLILSDVSGAEFTDAQISLLKLDVERGGGLLVTGGPFSLGVVRSRKRS